LSLITFELAEKIACDATPAEVNILPARLQRSDLSIPFVSLSGVVKLEKLADGSGYW
jgi:hypothetical protein